MKRIVIGPSVVEWASARIGGFGDDKLAVGFGIEDDGKLVAAVVFNDYNKAAICMHVVSDGSKRWMTKTLLWMVFDYAFNQLKVQRITGLVGEKNWDARKFDEHIGFTQETTLERAHPDGRLMVYRMFREDCRWIRRSHEYLKAA